MFLVHTNSDSAKREKVCHLRDSCTYNVVSYEENMSNFEIAVAKLKETLQNIKFATLCWSVAKAQVVCGAQRFLL
jgi:hypothetical protein